MIFQHISFTNWMHFNNIVLLCLFHYSIKKDEFYHLSRHENPARMRLKLEPSLYHDPHTAASNLRDNAVSQNSDERRLSHDFGPTSITPAAVNDILTEDEVVLLEEEMRTSVEPQQ